MKLFASIKTYKTTIFYAFTTLAMAAMIWFGVSTNTDFGRDVRPGVTFPRARVIEVIGERIFLDQNEIIAGRQDLRVEILTGEHRGRVVQALNNLPLDDPVRAREGQRIVLHYHAEDGVATLHTYERTTAMYLVILMFFALLALVAGKAGLRSVFGLIFTFVTLLFLLIPAITRGAPPGIMTVILSLVIITVSLTAIMGFERKTYVSIAGTAIGIACYAIFYLTISGALIITGLNMPEFRSLAIFGFQTTASISELLFCGILIAALGAIMDTTVSVASATAEISASDPDADALKLFRSGMRIARDAIGSSVNTLILAFTGAFFVTLILFRLENRAFHDFMNGTEIAIEVLRAISASAALVLAAPATVFIGAYVYGKVNKK